MHLPLRRALSMIESAFILLHVCMATQRFCSRAMLVLAVQLESVRRSCWVLVGVNGEYS